MKILLFGEFSGLFNCLEAGLRELGHEVLLASDGNGFKNYPSDFRWDGRFKNTRLEKVYWIGNIFAHRHLFKGYDVVLLISPRLFSYKRWPNALVYDYLIKHNKSVYLCSCGAYATNCTFWYNQPEGNKYHNYMKLTVEDPTRKHSRNLLYNKTTYDWEVELLNKIDGIIPIWYEYAEPYRDYKNLRKAIRIPINIGEYEYKPNKVDGKVVFYHGITRPEKGTKYIVEAFDRLREKYAGEAEFIAREKMPFNEYMKVIESANVIIDDANSFSVAMNGLFSMAKGKIIMGGAEPEGNRELGLTAEENPVFNICPDVDQICSVLEYIIKNKDKIPEWGLKSRRFVEKYHNHVEMAQQYVDVWTEDLKKKQK